MPVLNTAKIHFDDDIRRSRNLLIHAQPIPHGDLRDDVLRAAIMMAVGASDAYYCDAYGDLVARTLQAKDLQPDVDIPDRLGNLRIPAIAVIRQSKGGWRWRMAARELIEHQSVLSLEKIRELFNQFCRKNSKLVTRASIEPWILHKNAKVRLFGISATNYRKLTTSSKKSSARQSAVEKFNERFDVIFQRRHDCIHNCDRPKIATQNISDTAVRKVIEDIEFLVGRSHESLMSEFSAYLTNLGFSGQTRSRVSM